MCCFGGVGVGGRNGRGTADSSETGKRVECMRIAIDYHEHVNLYVRISLFFSSLKFWYCSLGF